MPLDAAIASGKEHRKPYRRGKAVCRSCRNHGGCPVCEGNRLRHRRLADIDARQQFDLFKEDQCRKA